MSSDDSWVGYLNTEEGRRRFPHGRFPSEGRMQNNPWEDEGIRRELTEDGKVWFRADEPAPDGRVYKAEIFVVCPKHNAQMLLEGMGPKCYCPVGDCTVEVLLYMQRRE